MKVMKNLHLISIACLLLMLSTVNAFAQEAPEKGQLELTFALGGVTSGDMSFDQYSEMFIDNSYAGTVRIGYYLSRLAAIEASATLRFDKVYYIEDTRQEVAPSEYPREDVVNYHFNLGFVYNLGDLQHVPYVTFGLGLSTLNYHKEYPVPAQESKFTIFTGLGYKYFLSEHFAARIELGFNAFDFEDVQGQNFFTMNWMLIAGVTLRLN